MSASAPAPRAGDRWRQLLRDSEVPQSVIDGAPEPAGSLEPERFRWRPEQDAAQPVRPSRRRALEALPTGGTVLDVGVGGGASSLGLVPKAGFIVGVDALPGMLESFAASAKAAGVAIKAILGTWPQIADSVPIAHVALSHHAVYRAVEIEEFISAMTVRARHRVVLEVSAHSPLSGLDELWKSMHGIDRLEWLVADELQAVLVAMGLPVEREDIVLPPRAVEVTPEMVTFARRRLYVGRDRDPEIEEYLRNREPQAQRVAALWWSGEATQPNGDN